MSREGRTRLGAILLGGLLIPTKGRSGKRKRKIDGRKKAGIRGEGKILKKKFEVVLVLQMRVISRLASERGENGVHLNRPLRLENWKVTSLF